MAVIIGSKIRELGILTPSCPRSKWPGHSFIPPMSYGESFVGYDLRVAETVLLRRGVTTLVSAIEHFWMPNDLVGIVHDKSTLARLGLAVQNTVVEPGWRGYLTLELTWLPVDRRQRFPITAGMPIAQVLFHEIAGSVCYRGKYQDQPAGAQAAI